MKFVFHGVEKSGLCGKKLTILRFNDLKEKAFGKHVGRGENAGNQYFSF